MTDKMRAFKTTCGVISIVFADTASQARYDTYKAAREAGYFVEFGEITVKRAPEYDNREQIDGRLPAARKCLDPEYLKSW